MVQLLGEHSYLLLPHHQQVVQEACMVHRSSSFRHILAIIIMSHTKFLSGLRCVLLPERPQVSYFTAAQPSWIDCSPATDGVEWRPVLTSGHPGGGCSGATAGPQCPLPCPHPPSLLRSIYSCNKSPTEIYLCLFCTTSSF